MFFRKTSGGVATCIVALALGAWLAFPVQGLSSQRNGGEEPAAPSVRANSFEVLRTLGDYANNLGDQFVDALLNLNGDSHWTDMGSGEGVAIENYFQIGTNEMAWSFAHPVHAERLRTLGRLPIDRHARVTGITYHLHRFSDQLPSYQHRLRHLVGRYLEIIPDAEIGQSDLISDVYGVIAYTYQLDVALQKCLTSLKRNGNFFIYMGVDMELTTVRVEDRVVPLLDWLAEIPGITVDTRALRGIANTRVTRITKNGNPIRIPALQFGDASNTNPPVRRFLQKTKFLEVAERPDVLGPGEARFSRVVTAPEGYRPPPMPPIVERRLPVALGQRVR